MKKSVEELAVLSNIRDCMQAEAEDLGNDAELLAGVNNNYISEAEPVISDPAVRASLVYLDPDDCTRSEALDTLETNIQTINHYLESF